MKSLWLIIGIALLAAGPAFAQGMGEGVDKGQFEVSVGGGGALPLGDFGDVSDLGFFGGLGVGYYVSPQLVIGAEGNYYLFSPKDEYKAIFEASDSTVTDVKWTTIQGTAYGKYLFRPTNVSPYIKAQVGMYNNKVKIEAGSGNTDNSNSDIGFAGGPGIQLKGQGNIGGFGEAMFHYISTEGSSTTFITLRVGVTFFLGKK